MNAAEDTRQLPRWRREFLEKLLREVELAGKVVLEAGCGDGILTRAVAERGRAQFVVGVDLGCAWKEGPGFATLPMDLNELEFPNGYFDVVFSQNVFEHVHQLDRAWAELKRVLKPGGLFVSEFAPLWNHSFGHHWYFETDDSFTCPVPPYGHLTMTKQELVRIARRETRWLTPQRAAAKEFLLGGACNKLFPADYRRIFLHNADFEIAHWDELRDDHGKDLPDAVAAKHPDVPVADFGVCGIRMKGTKLGGTPGLAPAVRKRASLPVRPTFLQRLARKPRKIWSRW